MTIKKIPVKIKLKTKDGKDVFVKATKIVRVK